MFAYLLPPNPPIAVEQHTGRQFTMDVLLNELAFQKVLLNSIDDTVQNREAAEEEARAEIRALEKQIRDLKRGSTTASNSQPSQNRSSSSKKPDPAPKNSTLSAAMDGYLSECFPSNATKHTVQFSFLVRSSALR